MLSNLAIAALLIALTPSGDAEEAPSACEDVYRDEHIKRLEATVIDGGAAPVSDIDDDALLAALIAYSNAWDNKDVDALIDMTLLPHPRAQQLERECLPKKFENGEVQRWTRYFVQVDETNPLHFYGFASVVIKRDDECIETTFLMGDWVKLWGEWRRLVYVGEYPVLGSPCPELYLLGSPVDIDDLMPGEPSNTYKAPGFNRQNPPGGSVLSRQPSSGADRHGIYSSQVGS